MTCFLDHVTECLSKLSQPLLMFHDDLRGMQEYMCCQSLTGGLLLSQGKMLSSHQDWSDAEIVMT